MNTKDLVKQFLEETPAGRERRNRGRAIWRVLERKYKPMESMTIEQFIVYQPEIESISRYCRMVQEEYEHLRGSDYPDGKALSQERQLELGYAPGYNRDIKLSTGGALR